MSTKKNVEPPTAEARPVGDSPQPPTDGNKATSKTEMIRQALQAGCASVEDGVAWIKQKFGEDVKKSTYQVTTSKLRKESGGKAKNKTPAREAPASAPARVAEPAPAVLPPASNGRLLPSEAARRVRDLVKQLGAEEVRDLVRLFEDA